MHYALYTAPPFAILYQLFRKSENCFPSFEGAQGLEKIKKEVVADLVGDYLFTDSVFLERLGEKPGLARRIYNKIKQMYRMATAGSKEARQLEQLKNKFEKMFQAKSDSKADTKTDTKAQKNTTQEGGVRYSLVGRTVDGLGIYKTNYPPNTPKKVKQADLIDLIQNVWSQKPITLTIVEDGQYVDITAKFNPELGARSDLAKIVFGNRKGTGAEKRMTLDLASDLYQIAAESKFSYSKEAVPKPDNPAHDGVTKYHYFLTNLVYKGNDGNYIDCHMNIDVKRNVDGDWFYSFAIEKGSAPQTLLAAVTGNSATLPNNNIFEKGSIVKKKFSLSSDSNGNQLSKGQQEYFKDSKNTTQEGGVRYGVSHVDSRLELSYDNSIMEAKDGSNGNEQREETREAFLGRTSETLPEIKERGETAFRYRRYSGQLSQNIQEAEEGLKKLGIPSVVVEQKEGNRQGTTTFYNNDAVAIPGVAVFIHHNTTLDALELVGHEVYHYLAASDSRNEYDEVLAANVDFSSKAFISYQQKYVEKIYFAKSVEIGSKEWATLMEETFAYITGDIHNGDPKGEVHAFLGDYDAVKAAWDSLVDNHKKNNDIIKAGSNEPVFSLSQNSETQTAYGDYRVSSEDVLLDGEQVQAEKTLLEVFMEEQIRRQEEEEKSRDAFWGAVMQGNGDTESVGAAPSGFDPVSHLQYKYGSLPEGEKAVRDDSLPKSTTGKDRVSLTARTVKGAKVTPDAFVDLLDQEVVGGKLSYMAISNNKTTQDAIKSIQTLGWEEALSRWKADVRAGKVSAELTAKGALLLNNAAKAGDSETWLDVLHDYQIMSTNAGQAVQANRILKTLDPNDSLYMIQKTVANMAEELGLDDVTVPKGLLDNYKKANTDAERNKNSIAVQRLCEELNVLGLLVHHNTQDVWFSS